MVAVPAETAVTIPLLVTVATVLLLLDHVTFLLVAFSGNTVAVNVSVVPIVISAVGRFSVTFVTGTDAAVTVTVQVAVLPPSCVVAIIVAEPADMAVTRPLLLTEATDGLLLVQFTVLLVALAGRMVGINVSEAPAINDNAVLFSVMPVTGTGNSVKEICSIVTCRDWLPAVTVTMAVRGVPVVLAVALTVISLFPLPDAG